MLPSENILKTVIAQAITAAASSPVLICTKSFVAFTL